ncbi:MAG: nitroreductase family protein [Betaproteobacteria bacterium]
MGTLAKAALDFIGYARPRPARGRAIAPSMPLPAPSRQGGMPLMQALALRRSQRDFSSSPLPDQVLSDLLWCAFGVNRGEGHGRTAPSAHDAQEVDIYVALPGGLYLYDPDGHDLSLVAKVDARNVTGYQDFVDEAPLDLVYVAGPLKVNGAPAEKRLVFSAVSVGAIVQNVYLYCASAGLATVVRGWLDAEAVSKALQLGHDERVICAQTVGYPVR